MTNIRNDHRSLCALQLKLFMAYLRNDRTLLSVCQCSAGTNFSLKQRLGLLFMYLMTMVCRTLRTEQ